MTYDDRGPTMSGLDQENVLRPQAVEDLRDSCARPFSSRSSTALANVPFQVSRYKASHAPVAPSGELTSATGDLGLLSQTTGSDVQ